LTLAAGLADVAEFGCAGDDVKPPLDYALLQGHRSDLPCRSSLLSQKDSVQDTADGPFLLVAELSTPLRLSSY